MAIAGMKWLGSKLGVDITGNERDEGGMAEPTQGGGGGGWVDQIGKTLFETGTTEDKDDGIPENEVEFVYSQANGRWEPHANAPKHVWDEFNERLKNPKDSYGKPLIQEVAAPPPLPPPPPQGKPSPPAGAGRSQYVDCFSTPSSSAASPVAQHSPHAEASNVTLQAVQHTQMPGGPPTAGGPPMAGRPYQPQAMPVQSYAPPAAAAQAPQMRGPPQTTTSVAPSAAPTPTPTTSATIAPPPASYGGPPYGGAPTQTAIASYGGPPGAAKVEAPFRPAATAVPSVGYVGGGMPPSGQSGVGGGGGGGGMPASGSVGVTGGGGGGPPGMGYQPQQSYSSVAQPAGGAGVGVGGPPPAAHSGYTQQQARLTQPPSAYASQAPQYGA